jgi:hypothetical protein
MHNKLTLNETSSIVAETDIDFIKKHFRYPLNSFQKYKSFIVFLVMIIVIALIAFFLISKGENDSSMKSFFRKSIPFLGAFISIIYGFYKFYKSFFFDKIKTSFSIEDNMILLTNFFKSNHFKYYVMHDLHDVFIMQSSLLKGSKEQEIVIFIAVDNEILMNSHICTSNIIHQHKRKVNELVVMLEKFVAQNKNIEEKKMHN